MANIPVIIQARMSSTRLPGKVLKPFAGKTFLESVLDRCARTRGISDVICATTDGADSDPIAELCERRGYTVWRGSEENVLQRYLDAAHAAKADAVVRITSDCPLSDPEITEGVIERFLEGQHALVTTNIPPSWPLGMDSEIVSMRALEEAAEEASIAAEREHVTTFIRRRPGRYGMLNLPCPTEGFSHWRITLDTEEDRQFFVALADSFKGDITAAGWREIFAHIEAHPELLRINLPDQALS